ncbi:KCU-star family selenoprotein [Helicobacter sp. T3_23-1056]
MKERFYPPVPLHKYQTKASKILEKLRQWYKKSDRFFHLLVGMPSYDKYVEHMRTKHPEREIKSQAEFFKEALEARYNGGVNRCC